MSLTMIRFGSAILLLCVCFMFQIVYKVEATPMVSMNGQLDSAGKRIVQDLDCYRMKLVIKSLTLRIHRLEMETFGVEKTPFELAEIDSWCNAPSPSLVELNKRNFDEIDRSGFRGFSKKNFEMSKRNFDEIDKSGFRGFTG